MKRIFALLLCLVLTLGFAACGNADGNGTENNKDNGKNENKAGVSFYVNCSGVKIELGADATALMAQLGTPASQSEMGACGDLGTVTKYVYEAIELYVLKNGDKATVDQITLKNDLTKTPEGIKIGSTKDEVLAACGKGYAKCDDSEIRYTDGNKNLKFTLRDGNVIAINYLVLS